MAKNGQKLRQLKTAVVAHEKQSATKAIGHDFLLILELILLLKQNQVLLCFSFATNSNAICFILFFCTALQCWVGLRIRPYLRPDGQYKIHGYSNRNPRPDFTLVRKNYKRFLYFNASYSLPTYQLEYVEFQVPTLFSSPYFPSALHLSTVLLLWFLASSFVLLLLMFMKLLHLLHFGAEKFAPFRYLYLIFTFLTHLYFAFYISLLLFLPYFAFIICSSIFVDLCIFPAICARHIFSS